MTDAAVTDPTMTDPAMTRLLDRRQMILGAACLATAGVAMARVPRHNIDLFGKNKLEKLVPEKIGDWQFYSKSGLVVPPADQLSDALYSQLLTRVYLSPDSIPVMMLVAQSSGQTGILQVHRPEYCYPAGGFTLHDKHVVPIALPGSTLDAVFMTATTPDRTEQLLYWTRVGDDMPTTWVQQRLSVARANLMGDVPDAVLVRISAVTNDAAAGLAAMTKFTRAFFASVPPNVRRMFDIDAR